MAQKRPFNEGKRHFKKKKKQKTVVGQGSNEEVLLADVQNLLRNTTISDEESESKGLPQEQTEVELEISELSSTGDGLAIRDGQVYVVPFAVPGDTVSAKVYKHDRDERYSLTDFLKVVNASKHRTEQPKCKYFTRCGGCQFQQLPYSYQLEHKRNIVEKAYRNFSNLPASAVPAIGDTIGSPLEYGYRTKLTPHFDGPPNYRSNNRHGVKNTWPAVPPIGFIEKGTKKTMDIEDCPIGTPAVRQGMIRERERVARDINTYQRGATLLLRESTERLPKNEAPPDENDAAEESNAIIEHHPTHTFRKVCITDNKATSTEYIDSFRFDNPAGSFFQNNNSILPVVTSYIRSNILGPSSSFSSSPSSPSLPASSSSSPQKITSLIDAYCGSGFFTVTLSSLFTHSIGIDISAQSIEYASKNASLNSLPDDSTRFIAADANALFSAVDVEKFPPDETVVVIDPPRKGCDEGFIRQLIEYGPARVCYVSCNVHTQARDVGWLVGGLAGGEGGEEGGEGEEGKERKGKGAYEIESIRGFDFFPQTSHVEGVAFLKRKGE